MSDPLEKLKDMARQYYNAFASGDKDMEELTRTNLLRSAFIFGERERYPRAMGAMVPSFAQKATVANKKVRR